MEETLWWGLTPRSSTVAAEDMEFGLALQSSRKAGADNPGSFHHVFDRETRDLLPRIKTCPLKRDHFKRKIAFQPIIFWGGYLSFRGLNFAESVMQQPLGNDQLSLKKPWQLCAFIEFQVYEQDVNGLRKARDKDGQREKCWGAACDYNDYNQVAIVPELWIILQFV